MATGWLATAFKTPPVADVLPATAPISHAQEIYQQLVALKQQRLSAAAFLIRI